MDRGKPMTGTRGPKSKITQQPPDLFIALGPKQSSPRDDPKRPVSLSKPSTSHLQPGSSKDKLKRESTQSPLAGGPQAKKLKVLPGSRPTSTLLGTDRLGVGSSQVGVEPWEALAQECDSKDIVEHVLNNCNKGNIEKAIAYILGSLRALRSQRFKLCKTTYTSLLLLCSCKSLLFTNDHVIAAIISILRRDVAASSKVPNKINQNLHVLLINILMRAFADSNHWPEIFIKIYAEDAVAERIWIDNPYCRPFVDNVLTAFKTKLPPKALLVSETWTSTLRETSSPLTINSVDDEEAFAQHKAVVDLWSTKVSNRFPQDPTQVEAIVLEAIREQVNRRQQPDNATKNFVKFLSIACGINEIRVIAVNRIELWLHNHKLTKAAQELLAYLCCNCKTNSQRDIEVIVQLSKLRLKNKPMVNFFNNCLREMVFLFPENLFPLMKYTIYNELSNARNTNNLIVVGALFQVAPEASADSFAEICLELLLNKEDYLRSLRALLKEINRVLRHDFNLLNVVHSLLKERKEMAAAMAESEHKDRIFFSLADMVCVCMLLCVTQQVREAASQSKRDVSVLKTFQTQVSNIQREAVTWLQDSAVRVFKPNPNEFHHVLLKVLFLEQAEQYCKIDCWPGENERNLFLRLTSEVPMLQATLLRILLIGISKEHIVHPNEALEICDQLVKRAANLPLDCAPPLVVDKIEIFEIFFNLCSYNHPENITLPIGYVPPNLAISTSYWKVWLILLIISSHNPSTVGSTAWNKYPALRMFMEMCITNHFSFPPPTMATIDEDYQSREQQTIIIEKQKILEFESHLAAATSKVEITEQNSLLLPQLMELRPEGDARRPPQVVLDQLQVLNNSHRMGHLLCRSRNPDFLLDIMSRQGGAHMPWLAELVHNSEGALAHLPVQCLCEYLLSTAPAEKLTKHGQLLAHLRTVVSSNDHQMACEVLEYLFRRLTSDHGPSRTQATKGLILILAPNEDPEVDTSNITWLTQFIFQFPHFAVIKPTLVQFLRQALQSETNPARVSSYINFLATQDYYESFADLNDLIADLSSVIIERHSVASYVLSGENNPTIKNLLSLFYLHIQKTKEFSKETHPLLETYSSSDYVIIHCSNGMQFAMQTLVIHAAIILLTYGPLENCEHFNAVLNFWFPKNVDFPKAVNPDTNETTTYMPDWIKLRMIRSNVSCLVDAAIEKVEPTKLVLFIQSFGVPTTSISKLLHALDRTTQLNPKLVVDSVLDKAYMIQLVEVQNKRGALGGSVFVKAIEMQIPVIPDVDVKVDLNVKNKLPLTMGEKLGVAKVNEVNVLLENLFNSRFICDKNKLVSQLIKAISIDPHKIPVSFNYIKSLPLTLVVSTINQVPTISLLFRILFTIKTVTDDHKLFASSLMNDISNKNSTTEAVLKEFLKKHSIDEKPVKPEIIEIDDDIQIIDLCEPKPKIKEPENEEKKAAILVDWFSAMELEKLDINEQKKQLDLLFSRKNLSYRPLLISLVLQRASWQGLHSILKYICACDVTKVCPVAALDFLTALTQSPKLWQGRDKAIPKHYHFEDLLQLNQEQVTNVIMHILEEAKAYPENWQRKMEVRLQLLLKCIGPNATNVVKWLIDRTNDKHAQELLLMIYMSLPCSGQEIIQSRSDLAKEAYQKNCPSAVDEISHTLLSALASTPRIKDWGRKSQDLERCVRKLTSTHPILVLRQLPMLAGSLKGRAQYDWSVLKNRGHLNLFRQILGIVELLQPIVFSQTESLSDLLDSYFLLLHYHGHSKDLVTLINRLVVFSQNWMGNNIKAASKYLQEQGPIINELQLIQPGIRPLLSNVSLPTSDQNSSEFLVGAVGPRSTEPLPPNWPQLIAALQNFDNVNAFQEIEHLTAKRPGLLKNISHCLYNGMSSNSSVVRALALQLVVRWLKFNPKAAAEALPSILTCLDSRNADVVTSVLDRLSDLVSVMQEYAKIILTRVFKLGMKSTLSATSNISDSLYLLSLQSGC